MGYNWDGLPSRDWEKVETTYDNFGAVEEKRWYTVEHGYQLSYPEIAVPEIGIAFVGEPYHISVRVSECMEPEEGGETRETGIPFTGEVLVKFRNMDYPLTYKTDTGYFEGEVQGPPAAVWNVDAYTFTGVIIATNDRGESAMEYAVKVYRPFPEIVSVEIDDCHVGEQTELRAYARFTSIPESEEVKKLSFPGTVQAVFQGETYTLSPKEENIFTTTVIAPTVSSWLQENHRYVGILTAVLGEDEDSLRFTVRVRENTPPEVISQKPWQDMFIANDCSPLFSWVVSDRESGLARVEITLNSSPCIYQAEIVNGVAYWQMPVVSAGLHTVTVSCIDNDDNVTKVVRELTGVELIRDRTEDDLTLLRKLDGIPRANMTLEQKVEWEQTCHRGGYTVADLNRVETAVRYLTNRLAEHGFDLALSTEVNWKMTDKPSVTQMRRYLGNVSAVVKASGTLYGLAPDVYGKFPNRPEPPPVTLNSLHFENANRIEGSLAAVEWFLDWLETYQRYEETKSNTWEEIESIYPAWDNLKGRSWGEVQLDPIKETNLLLPWQVREMTP